MQIGAGAATGRQAEVAVTGESRFSDDVFGRATGGASGSSTNGQVTAIAAQVTHCICREAADTSMHCDTHADQSASPGLCPSPCSHVQNSYATPRTSGAAILATAASSGTGTVQAYGTVRPGALFQTLAPHVRRIWPTGAATGLPPWLFVRAVAPRPAAATSALLPSHPQLVQASRTSRHRLNLRAR